MVRKLGFNQRTLNLILFATIIGVAIIQVGSLLIDRLFDVGVLTLGPAFMFLAAAAGAWLSFILLGKLSTGQNISRQDLFAILLVAAFIVTTFLILPDLTPEMFSVAQAETETMVQSMVG